MISITIEDNGGVSLKTTNGIEETEIATTIVVEAMRNLMYKSELQMIKNGCKIIREARQTQFWPINSSSHHNDIIIDDFKVSCTAKSSGRYYDV